MISNRHRSTGFTLIELMVVVAIVAILATLATQSYSRYMYRARRADGQEMLMRIANAQERYYATFNKYGADPVADLKFASNTSDNGYYTVTITAKDPTKSYVATAKPGGVQATDACGSLSIDSSNAKLPDTTDKAANANGRCW